jgi:hypothetical protein
MDKVTEVLDGLRDEERRLSVELAGVRRAIAALEEVLGIGVAGAVEPAEVTPAEQSALPSEAEEPEPVEAAGPYATSGFYEAAATYLASAGGPRTAREIAEALQAGGYPTRATNFVATVRTMLHRKFSAEPFGIRVSETGGRWFVSE